MMLRTVTIIAVALATAVVGAPAGADHGVDQANGGGQVVLDPDALERAGDTVGFTARADESGVRGQFTYVGTSEAGQEMDRWHGDVQCLEVDGDTAVLGGTIQSNEGSNVSGGFAVRVKDNGEPTDGAGVDMITLEYGEDTDGDCTDDLDGADDLTLARGNAQVHDGDA